MTFKSSLCSVYGKVDISNNGGVTTFFYYIDDETYCIEQPYQGVYETDSCNLFPGKEKERISKANTLFLVRKYGLCS